MFSASREFLWPSGTLLLISHFIIFRSALAGALLRAAWRVHARIWRVTHIFGADCALAIASRGIAMHCDACIGAEGCSFSADVVVCTDARSRRSSALRCAALRCLHGRPQRFRVAADALLLLLSTLADAAGLPSSCHACACDLCALLCAVRPTYNYTLHSTDCGGRSQ